MVGSVAELVASRPYWYIGPSKQNIDRAEFAALHFFNAFTLETAKEWLWQWLKAAMTGDAAQHWEPRHFADLLSFYEELCQVLDACHDMYSEAPVEW